MKKTLIIITFLLLLAGCRSQHVADFATGAIYSGADLNNYHGYNRRHQPKIWEKGGYLNPYKTTIQTDDGTVFINESIDVFGDKRVTVRDYRY